jgi:hypothetical protein
VRLIAIFSLALAAASLYAAEVYRSVAPDGTVIYSDRPNGPDAEPIFVAAELPAPIPVPQPAAATAQPAPSPAAAFNDEAARIERELAEQRERNCAIARSRVENYSAAHRLYRQLPNGEREYLDDAEIDEARAQAAADVEAWCS